MCPHCPVAQSVLATQIHVHKHTHTHTHPTSQSREVSIPITRHKHAPACTPPPAQPRAAWAAGRGTATTTRTTGPRRRPPTDAMHAILINTLCEAADTFIADVKSLKPVNQTQEKSTTDLRAIVRGEHGGVLRCGSGQQPAKRRSYHRPDCERSCTVDASVDMWNGAREGDCSQPRKIIVVRLGAGAQKYESHKFAHVDRQTDEIGHAASLLLFAQIIRHTGLGRSHQTIAKSERKTDSKRHSTRGAKAEQQ